ncbi:MAG: DUF1292 domain-containing protein [Bacillota bacterium]|nr:DUF1292 domain-containing protein [Bacillota bacterium]
MPTENNGTFTVLADDGTEELINILFSYVNEERGKTYYFLYRSEAPEDVIVMSSVDDENLEPVDDDELEEAEEVFNAYMDDPKIAEARK